MEQWTIGALLETAGGYLRGKGSASPRLDAELLLAETLGLERIHLYTEYDRPLAPSEVDHYRTLIARRAAHEPVAYILGRAYFRHLVLEVNPDVLIPRPETEELVDVALELLRRRPAWTPRCSAGEPGHGALPATVAAPSAVAPLIVDAGTGSGAIALSLAQEAGLRVLAIDTSAEALAVAARNAAAMGLDELVEFEQSDLLSGLAENSLHLVVSNPPYVTSSEMETLAPNISLFEPACALDGGPDGLAVIRRLLPQAAQALRPGGNVLVEVGDGQAAEVVRLAREAGFSVVSVHKDLSRKERIVEATLPGAFVVAASDLDEAQAGVLAKALQAGAVIGIPTDTVYGIGARWDSPTGVRRLFAAKARSSEQPVAVLFSSVEAVKEALPDLDSTSARVLEALLPGPFTFVVATAVPRPSLVGTEDSLGVRVPANPALLGLLRSLGAPLAATSANPTGDSEAVTLADVDARVLSHCSVAVKTTEAHGRDGADGSPAFTQGRGTASTVVDLRPLASGGAPLILREGAVPGTEVLERIAALR